MTVSNDTNRVTFAGDGVTTSFGTTPIKFFATSDMLVYVTTDATGVTTKLVEDTGYTVSGGDTAVGAVGTVSLAGGSAPHGALLSGTTLVLIREVALLQEADFVQNDATNANVAEAAIDKITMALQRLDDRLARSLVISDGDVSGADFTVPTPVASRVLGWNSAATALQLYSAADIDKALVSAFGETLIDDATASDALTTLGVSTFIKTLLDDTTASDALTTLGVSTFIKTLLDDTTAATARGTLGFAADSPQMWMPTSGRLTLTTALPVTTADVTGATTVYFTPYKGNVIQLYDGTDWVPAIFTELSQATTDATKSPAAVAADSNYDVFVWNDAGTLRATRGPAWTSATARGTGAGTTELELFEGRYVNKVDVTNGPAARRGLYVGTIRSDASSQINDSLAKRHVWNNFNRVVRPMQVLEATDTWVYSTLTYRQANANTANQLDTVIGLAEDEIQIEAAGAALTSGATPRAIYVGVGVGSTTAKSGRAIPGNAAASGFGSSFGLYSAVPAIGRQFYVWLEAGDGGDTQTWRGDGGGVVIQSGIFGRVMA